MKTENQKHEKGLPSKVKPLKWRKFRLTFLFAFTALVAITITTTAVVNRIASEIAESSVIRNFEEKAVRDAEHLVSGHHLAGHDTRLTMQDLVSPEGLNAILASEESFNIVKFNLFNLNSVSVWSTDPASIGKINHSTSLWTKAETGGVGSKLERDKTLVILSGESRTTDIVETYLPLRDTPSGEYPIVSSPCFSACTAATNTKGRVSAWRCAVKSLSAMVAP